MKMDNVGKIGWLVNLTILHTILHISYKHFANRIIWVYDLINTRSWHHCIYDLVNSMLSYQIPTLSFYSSKGFAKTLGIQNQEMRSWRGIRSLQFLNWRWAPKALLLTSVSFETCSIVSKKIDELDKEHIDQRGIARWNLVWLKSRFNLYFR